MKITKFTVGQLYFQASLLVNGRQIDNGSGEAFTTQKEAATDGKIMVSMHDPEASKNGAEVDFVVREMCVDSICEDEADCFGSAHSVRQLV